MSADVAELAVAKAVALLDQLAPANWRDEVTLEYLDMGDGEQCVLGQIYGDYNVGITALQESASEQAVLIEGEALDAFESGYYQEAWEKVLSA